MICLSVVWMMLILFKLMVLNVLSENEYVGKSMKDMWSEWTYGLFFVCIYVNMSCKLFEMWIFVKWMWIGIGIIVLWLNMVEISIIEFFMV